MSRRRLDAVALAAFVVLCGCGREGPRAASASSLSNGAGTATALSGPMEVRATGTLQAVRVFSVQVPRPYQVRGSYQGRLTLVKLASNGAIVKKGDILAEFDRTRLLEAARDVQAEYEDLTQQVREKAARNRSEKAKRMLTLGQAEADLATALIQLKKGPVLAEVERVKNEAKAASARARVESLKKIDSWRTEAEASALDILQLQTERQKVVLERARNNAERLLLRAPLAGMVALESLWRGGSMGAAQEGDQLYPGQVLMKIFDPSEMEVRALITEPDHAAVEPGSPAAVQLDAYPGVVFRARFISASPVASSVHGSPIKNFAARFRLEQSDARLLPELSAAVIMRAEAEEP